MISPLNSLYFVWLTDQIWFQYRRHCTTTYDDLMQILWVKEFVWMVPNDDNRVADGLELRYLFLNEESLQQQFSNMHRGWHDGAIQEEIVDFRSQPCSTLEVIVALARRLQFAAQGHTGWWAWRLIENLELHKMRDPISRKKRERAEEILEALIFRTYTWDGVGGFFPLAFPKDNMTRIEIWYQMSAYLEEFGHP